jgi:hypothetical protein
VLVLLGLMYFWIALTVIVLTRTRRINQHGIDNRALVQRYPPKK